MIEAPVCARVHHGIEYPYIIDLMIDFFEKVLSKTKQHKKIAQTPSF
jgi:hypothetical protein